MEKKKKKKKKSYLVSFASIRLDYVTGLAVRRCRESALEMYVCSFKMKSYRRGGGYSVDTRLFLLLQLMLLGVSLMLEQDVHVPFHSNGHYIHDT